MPCVSCGRGYHQECDTKCSKCHSEPIAKKTIEPVSGKLGRPELAYDDIKDPKSTGRKRAARLYPIRSDLPCEWRGLKNCGGGLKPIVGCFDGVQRQRHHGPIKDPRHNEKGNVHRVCTKCVAPETRILTHDLRWERADQLTIGDILFGFTENIEGRGTSVQFERATVVNIERVLEPSYLFEMSNGDELVSSHAHQWVGSSPGRHHIKWRSTEDLHLDYNLRKLVHPWETKTDWDAGWLAGILDGEGCIGADHNLSVVQKTGNLCDQIYEELTLLSSSINTTYRDSSNNNPAHQDTEVFRISRLQDIMTILGSIRPYRLLEEFYTKFDIYNRNPLRIKNNRIAIERKKFIGKQEVISIETTSGTYFAEGYLSHNCHRRWHAANDPIYSEADYAKLPHEPLEATAVEIADSNIKWRGTTTGVFPTD